MVDVPVLVRQQTLAKPSLRIIRIYNLGLQKALACQLDIFKPEIEITEIRPHDRIL